jgi:hypothetical protein
MKYFFDRHTDAWSIDLAEAFDCAGSEPLAPGVTLHVDQSRRPLMLEMQGASKIADTTGLISMRETPVALDEIARRMISTPAGEAIWRKVARRIIDGEGNGGKNNRLAIPDLASPFSIR